MQEPQPHCYLLNDVSLTSRFHQLMRRSSALTKVWPSEFIASELMWYVCALANTRFGTACSGVAAAALAVGAACKSSEQSLLSRCLPVLALGEAAAAAPCPEGLPTREGNFTVPFAFQLDTAFETYRFFGPIFQSLMVLSVQ